MSTIYLGTEALDHLSSAQRTLEEHLLTCGACGTNRPCYDRIEAERVFLRYGRLPRRTPGLIGGAAVRRPGFGWFHRP
ncbi:hypothetical protein V6U90_10095 [Micromonospora sp. CPCC 206060]|uniref:hypothetical protein n=1 Tax=Micromonospora sp. CPCC 206060 TaxID=3122406 RepID=UPI002FEEE32E